MKKALLANIFIRVLQIEPPKMYANGTAQLKLQVQRQNNLKNITVEFPLNTLCVVSGVSGGNKTTLVKQILYPALKKAKRRIC